LTRQVTISFSIRTLTVGLVG